MAGLVGEAGGMLATLIMALLTLGSPGFSLALGAFLAMIVMHGIYWVFTHPVNNFWVRDVELSGLGSTFFSAFAPKTEAGDWKSMRDVWEYSHVARAALAMLSLLAITIAVTSGQPSSGPGSG